MTGTGAHHEPAESNNRRHFTATNERRRVHAASYNRTETGRSHQCGEFSYMIRKHDLILTSGFGHKRTFAACVCSTSIKMRQKTIGTDPK